MLNPLPVEETDSYYVERTDELKRIDYYLDQAIAGSKSSKIIIYGARSTGKTSLLNWCDRQAPKK